MIDERQRPPILRPLELVIWNPVVVASRPRLHTGVEPARAPAAVKKISKRTRLIPPEGAVSLPSDLVVPGGSPLELSDLADRPPGGRRSTDGIIQAAPEDRECLGVDPLDSFNIHTYP